LFGLTIHLNSRFAVTQNIKLLGAIFLLGIISSIVFYLRKKRGLNNDLTDTTESGILNLYSGRILLFFGAAMISLGALGYSFLTNDYDDKLYLSFSLAIFLLVTAILTYIVEEIKKNISIILTAAYSLVVFYFVFLCYFTSLDPFFVICQIVILSLGTVIFEKTVHFVIFSLIITSISFYTTTLISFPLFSDTLYIVGTIFILFVSIIGTYIRLRLSDRLIFANTVINDGGSLVIAAKKNGDIIYINKTFTKVLGYSEEEVMGRGWWNIRKLHSEDTDSLSKIQSGELETTATVLLQTKDNKQKWIRWNNSILENGIVVGIGNDITERKAYEEQFRKLVENAKDIIYTTDVKGCFDYINDVTTEYTGYSKEELIGKSYKTLVREDFKHKIEAFYKEQIKNKIQESYREFPFTRKDGRTLWVGQSVLFKYNPQDNRYEGAQIICRDVTERVFAEEKLKQHNADLSVINLVKEIVLASNETVNLYTNILTLLGNNSDKSHYFSVNVFDKYQPLLHTYSLSTEDKKVHSVTNAIDSSLKDWLHDYKNNVFEFELDEEGRTLYKNLHQPVNIYKSAVIFPITHTTKTYGFLGFFSLYRNAYTADTAIMVKDICTSFTSYFVQYEQNKIIENYSKQLEILNESKTKLISYTNLNDVYKGIIDLLSDNIENVFRVSILVHDLERNTGNLFFQDPETSEITSKFISTKDVPVIPNHLKGHIYEKPDFENDPNLSEEDKLWLSRGAKAVISLPITINGNLFASVNLLSPIANNFTDQHKALIKEINDSAATVIEQIQFKEIISEKNKDISDNITYARRIQSALMPTEELLKELLPESFLIFSQRDSLGGDFYWFEKRDENIFLAVGDCTGHGVSGSLLTILASDYIKQAVEGKGYTDPALILEYLSNALQGTLNKYSEDEILDGLDISFGIYNTNTKMLLFSSAIHYFFLARNNELIEYKGNRKAIGGLNISSQENNFTTYMVQLETNDVVYFTTDGFADQLESRTEKRYGKARLKQLLLQINDKNVNSQKEILIKEHLKWKGSLPQTDDICFVGFKI
jgi:PAS domain S-box-containing protein